MKKLTTIFILTLFFLGSCEKPENEQNISRNGQSKSHENGRNCMTCHYKEGSGEGWFTVGGTITGNYHNGKIVLFPNGFNNPPIKEIEIDDRGNVFTTEDIDFSVGMNVVVVNSNGDSLKMPQELYVGQCNLCHGKTEKVIEMY